MLSHARLIVFATIFHSNFTIKRTAQETSDLPKVTQWTSTEAGNMNESVLLVMRPFQVVRARWQEQGVVTPGAEHVFSSSNSRLGCKHGSI